MRWVVLLGLVLGGGCRQLLDLEPGTLGGDAADGVDSDADAAVLDDAADPVDATPVDAALGPWGTPVKVANTTMGDSHPSLPADQLELYFARTIGNISSIYVMTRASLQASWSNPSIVPNVNAGYTTAAIVSLDGLSMLVSREVNHRLVIYQGRRATRTQPWGSFTAIPELTSSGAYDRIAGSLTADGTRVVFATSTTLGGAFDLYEGSRAGATGTFTNVSRLSFSTNQSTEGGPNLSPDGLSLHFNGFQFENNDLYVTTRASTADAWSTPELISALSVTNVNDYHPWVSDDGRTAYWGSDRMGGGLFFAQR